MMGLSCLFFSRTHDGLTDVGNHCISDLKGGSNKLQKHVLLRMSLWERRLGPVRQIGQLHENVRFDLDVSAKIQIWLD